MDTDGWTVFDLIVDILFILDVIVNCLTSIYIQDQLITDIKKIIKNYAKTWMIVDVISAVPTSLLLENKNLGTFAKLAKFPRLYRVFKLMKLFKINNIFGLRDIFYRIPYKFQLSSTMKRFLQFLLIFGITCHILTCLWYLLSTLNPQMNWVLKYGVTEKSNSELYLISLYWLITTISTVGYGDIVPVNANEKIMCIVVMLFGAFTYSYIVGSITSLIYNSNQRNSRIQSKLLILQDITKDLKLSEHFKSRLKKAIELDQSKVQRAQADMFNSLPRRLMLQLNLLINKKLVEHHNRFFKSSPIAFISKILENLKPLKLSPNELIFITDDLSDELYFITRGQVLLFEFYLKSEITFEKLGENEFFGEVGILLAEPRAFCAKTSRASDFLVINRQEFLEILRPFEELRAHMVGAAECRKESYLEKYEKALREFISHRQLVHSIVDSENQTKAQDEEKAESLRKIFKIRESLSARTLKLLSSSGLTASELKLKLTEIETRILILKNNLAK